MDEYKTYIPDTNIAIDDAYFLRKFLKHEKNKVILPDVVLGELDKLKKNPEIGVDARQFLNYFYKIVEANPDLSEGVNIPLGPGQISGKLFISNDYLKKPTNGEDILTYHPDIGENDLNIIRTAAVYTIAHPNEHVVLVSNDKNVVSIARINGVTAEYMRTNSADPSKLNKGYRLLDANEGMVKYLSGKSNVELKTINEPWVEDLIANEYIVFLNDHLKAEIKKSKKYDSKMLFSIDPQLVKRYDIIADSLVPLKYTGDTLIRGFGPKNLEQLLFIDQLMNEKIHIKAVRADAGTGKSFLELLVALDKTIERRQNKQEDAQIRLIRRAVFSEDYGFLPGDIVEKNRRTYDGIEYNYNMIMSRFISLYPKLQASFADKFSDVLNEDDENALLRLLPFSTIRGLTVGPNDIVIGEEWQNTEVKFSKVLMDRNGDGEVYVNGDFNQTDNPHTSLERNGLSHMMKVIQDISKRARKTRDPQDVFDASITGIMTLINSERGIISSWANRNLSSSR